MFQSNVQLKSSGAGHAGTEQTHAPHVTPLSVYFKVFGALIFLTVVTVGVSLLGLPPAASLIVAMLVALVKASVVALWFMHLISEERFYGFILVSTVFFMALFFIITLVDLSGRGATNPEETPEYWNKYSHELVDKPKAETPPNPTEESGKSEKSEH